jgi:rare lipoprotein A
MATSGCSNIQTEEASSWIGYTESGKASYYSTKHQYKKTASGELFDADINTAAHKKIPFDSKVKVTNVQNGKSVIAKVNDRGPYVQGRIIDLSRSAFSSIASMSAGVITVKVEVVE